MTLIEALRIVRNMAYEYDHAVNVLHDVSPSDDSDMTAREIEATRNTQTAALDIVDAYLIADDMR